MNKHEFLSKLNEKIANYPPEETAKSLEYYSEMIDDRVEDGMTEGEAVASLGSVDEIADQIRSELPIVKLVKQKAKETKQSKVIPLWAIIMLIISAPVWIPLVFALFTFILTLYLVIWCIDISLFTVFLNFVAAALFSLILTLTFLFQGSGLNALFYFGFALASAGLSILLFLIALLFAKGIVLSTKTLWKSFKKGL